MTNAARSVSSRVPSITDEFEDADLGDTRRTKRLLGIVEAFNAAPDRSLPKIARDAAELEGFYRFFENAAFGLKELLAPHARATADRVLEQPTALAIHDLTQFVFPLADHLREGCERMGNRQGFVGHVSLAVSADGSKRPLGVLGCRTWTKAELPARKRPGQRKNPKRKVHSCGRTEGKRWAEFISEAEALVGGPGRLVHVVDAEADGYPLYAWLVEHSTRFVVRMTSRRMVELVDDTERQNLSELGSQIDSVHEVEVPLSRRRGKQISKRPPRKARQAKLSFRASKIVLRPATNYRGASRAELPTTIELNVVWVTEIDPPPGEEPVEWILGTTEPIATADDVRRIVEFYKTRWLIEEFFKALKTGCAFEKRQLETRGALQKLLAISLVVAWRVLLLRNEARRAPTGTAKNALSALHLEVLRRTGRVPLSKSPTVQEALNAVAALGGHIKNNGSPGLIVLSRGMECLLERVVGFVSALELLGAAPEM